MTYLLDTKFVTLFVTLKAKTALQLSVMPFSAVREGFEAAAWSEIFLSQGGDKSTDFVEYQTFPFTNN